MVFSETFVVGVVMSVDFVDSYTISKKKANWLFKNPIEHDHFFLCTELGGSFHGVLVCSCIYIFLPRCGVRGVTEK
jgi:hypothetical protein